MIKQIRDYYELELKDNKGKIFKMEELPVDLMFMTLPSDVQKTLVVPYLASEGKVKLYLGVQTNSSIVPMIIEKVGELSEFNDHKQKGPFVDTAKISKEISESLKDLYETDKEEFKKQYEAKFNEEFQKQVEKAKELRKIEVEITTEKSEIKVHKEEFMLVPHTVDLKDYQRVLSTIREEGYSVYSEQLFVEIL